MMLGLGLSVGAGGGGWTPQDFVFTAATTGAAETFTIPARNNGVFDAKIDWGDGSAVSTITAYNDADLAHVYADAGTYTITVSGQFPNVYFYGDATMAAKVRTVESLGVMGWVTLNRAFSGCTGMTSFSGGGDTSGVVDMFAVFSGCAAIISADLSGMDTSSVTSMASLFYNNTSLTDLVLGGLNTSSVTNASWMFQSVPATNVSVSGFEMSSCTNIAGMLYGAGASDLEIDGWNISNVTNMNSLAVLVTIPTPRYDAILIAWDALTVQPGLSPHFGGSQYTLGGAAEAARSRLIANDLWTITDGGGV